MNPTVRSIAATAHHASRSAPEVMGLMTGSQQQGKGSREIARELNWLNICPRMAASSTLPV
jgi:hypothetical protein